MEIQGTAISDLPAARSVDVLNVLKVYVDDSESTIVGESSSI